jgi:hypothetical protein
MALLMARLFHMTALRLLGAAALLLAACGAHAAPSEYELKAAFIYQVAKFVEWPASNAPLRLCVIGGNPFGAALETVRGKAVNARKLEIVQIDAAADPRECHLLFIAAGAERNLERINAIARGTGILTLGDTEGFARRGVMVNFYLENDKVRFEINLESARQGGLNISSRLLALARIVGS